jgi:hypothetical protein
LKRENEQGVCVAGKISDVNSLRRTKFNNKENCQNGLQTHWNLEVLPRDYIVYKCKVCHTWHFGKYEWSELYGKK